MKSPGITAVHHNRQVECNMPQALAQLALQLYSSSMFKPSLKSLKILWFKKLSEASKMTQQVKVFALQAW